MKGKIKATCPVCDSVGYVPEDYVGKVKCPKCKSVFNRTGNPIPKVRKQLLGKLADLEQAGFSKATWIGGNDEHACKKCRTRHGVAYTIQQMRVILNSDFCESDPFEQGCRCTVGACRE